MSFGHMVAINTTASPSSPSGSTSASPPLDTPSRRGPFALMTTLFFLWGFMTVFNDILIPRFKDAFTLSYFQAMLVQFAFFGAYFLGSLAYFIISVKSGDPIARIGYKNGIILGLLISAAGSGLFWPAAVIESYWLFLVALFMVGLGFAMLQIAANPYVTILGPERTASSRLNLAQGFNSFGTTVGPLVGGWLIFEYFSRTGAHGAESVKVPYLVFCLVFVLAAVAFGFVKLPEIAGQTGEKIEGGVGAWRFLHVKLGALAIFFYVGGEVAVGSSIISFLGQPDIASLGKMEASHYVSVFWGGMLIGRFMGAAGLSLMSPGKKRLILAAIPLAGFAVLWGVRGWDVARMYWPFLLLAWVLFQVGRGQAGRSLMLFAATVSALLAIAIAVGGTVAMWCVVGAGLFSSIGFTNIFSLAIEGVGIYKSQAASLLVMAILGGALLPPVQGYIADAEHSLRPSFILPLLAYAYVAFYGWKGYRMGRADASLASAEAAPATSA
jgi:FHS family L-fucose permease-like MFS transporter